MSVSTYSQRVQSKMQQKTGLCVGFDPSTLLLQSWGQADTMEGLLTFSERMTEVCLRLGVGFVKFQSAYYERFGWEGIRLLTDINQALRRAGIITVLDGKRGDIGSTAIAYADAYLSEHDQTKYDALTINPYLGYDTCQPFIEKTKTESVGIFIIVRSSNPGGKPIQTAQTDEGQAVAAWLASCIQKDNTTYFGEKQPGAIGAVIGATLPQPTSLLKLMPNAFFLCPGVGAQGAQLPSVVQQLGHYAKQCIFPVSRGISLGLSDKTALITAVKQFRHQLEGIYA